MENNRLPKICKGLLVCTAVAAGGLLLYFLGTSLLRMAVDYLIMRLVSGIPR